MVRVCRQLVDPSVARFDERVFREPLILHVIEKGRRLWEWSKVGCIKVSHERRRLQHVLDHRRDRIVVEVDFPVRRIWTTASIEQFEGAREVGPYLQVAKVIDI